MVDISIEGDRIVLELNHERYERLIVEVEDPAAAVKSISAAIAPKRR